MKDWYYVAAPLVIATAIGAFFGYSVGTIVTNHDVFTQCVNLNGYTDGKRTIVCGMKKSLEGAKTLKM